MKEEDQQIAIAEWCGWKWWKHTKSETYIFGHPDRTKESLDDDQMQWEICETPKVLPSCYSNAPDYLHDFNAIQEAVMRLSIAQQIDFVRHLWETNPKSKIPAYSWNQAALSQEIWWTLATATAAQRREALLRTIGKWKEGV